MEGSSKNVLQLEQDCNHLRENLDQVKEEIVRILSDKEATSKENTALKEQITELANKVEVSTQHPSDSFTVRILFFKTRNCKFNCEFFCLGGTEY
jgi:predicted  nucleic acid-binding Zn-ribbon protein